ncbi:MAG: nucleoside hydrolase-like domain-containing protein [Planctomycetota bacterium]
MKQSSTAFVSLFALVFAAASCFAARADEPSADEKPRVIVTTDGEIDDRCSMIRYLMYANEWETLGLILSSSKYHWKGDETTEAHKWEGESWLPQQLDLYAKVYPDLAKNCRGFPSADELRRHVFVGNIATEGDMREETPGSNRIVEVLLDGNLEPVWLQAWGGANTIARALKTIEERHPERKAEVARKAKLFLITYQDQTYQTYISRNWPEVETLISTAFGAIAYRWNEIMPPDLQQYFDAGWMKENILKNHGPLCAAYEARQDGSFRSEGDSPAFMHLINVGLGSDEHPSYGGWGGRFQYEDGYWKSAADTLADGKGDPKKAILRWAAAFQNDWAARADWCVKSPDQCNHPPVAVCNSDRTQKVLKLAARPGARVELSAAGSSDPDGDQLTYHWSIYREAGTYGAAPPIEHADQPQAVVVVPQDAQGKVIHVILEVTDSGSPPLTRYRRVILDVTEGATQPRSTGKSRGERD